MKEKKGVGPGKKKQFKSAVKLDAFQTIKNIGWKQNRGLKYIHGYGKWTTST